MKFRLAKAAPVTFTFLALAMAGCAAAASPAAQGHAASGAPAG